MKKDLVKNLVGVQMALKAPKNKFNEFGNFKFRSAEDILEEVKPLLAGLGLVLTISDEMVVIGDRYYIKATATLTDGEDSVSVTAYAREDETRPGISESQCTGCSSSYARKYALNGLFCIDDGTDSDSFDNKRQKVSKTEKTNAELLKEFCTVNKESEDTAVLKKFYDFYVEKCNDFQHFSAANLWKRWKSNER